MIDAMHLESQKRLLLSRVDGWTATRLSYRPSPGAWSVLQVLDHLVRTEEEILALAKQGVSAPHRIGLRDRLGSLFITKLFQTD